MKDNIYFSELHNITVSDNDDWFDLRLDRDTHLCIDPFLVFKSKDPRFKSCHSNFMQFFESAFRMASRIEKVPSEVDKKTKNLPSIYKKLIHDILLFPEVEEICLGFALRGTGGAGMAGGFATELADALIRLSKKTSQPPKHFEEIEIFTSGIGQDKISDATANLIKKELTEYTTEICQRLNVPMKWLPVNNFSFDDAYGWDDQCVYLPLNPFNGKPILLVPKVFLRHIPSISAREFHGYLIKSNKSNEQLRAKLNFEIHEDLENQELEQKSQKGSLENQDLEEDKKKNKKDKRYLKGKILTYVNEHPEKLSEYIDHVERNSDDFVHYDLEKDDNNLYSFPRTISKFVYNNPIPDISCANEKEFHELLAVLINQLKMFAEEFNGYKLLWEEVSQLLPHQDQHSFKFRHEKDAQDLLRILIGEYCAINNIKLKKEEGLGENPVEVQTAMFKSKVLFLAKLVRNVKLEKEDLKALVSDLTTKGVRYCYYVVFVHDSNDIEKLKKAFEKIKFFDFKSIFFKPVIINVMLDRDIDMPSLGAKHMIDDQEVCISYARGGTSGEIADRLCEILAGENITVVRDSDELKYKDSLKKFMERLGRGKCVITLINKKYLQSEYCMFELMELAKNRDMQERIIPIILGDADIYNPVEILEYVKYWSHKSEELEIALREVSAADSVGVRNKVDLYAAISRTISQHIEMLSDLVVSPIVEQMNSDFKEVVAEIKKSLI
jgi:TIR domain